MESKSKMLRTILWLVTPLIITACVNRTVTFENHPSEKQIIFSFVDKHQIDDVSFITESANTFSCMSTIMAVSEKDIIPNRAALLKSYLAENLSIHLKGKTVILERFDIYWNRQREMKSNIPVATANPDQMVAATITAATLSNPGPVYGCNGENRGEYSIHELSTESFRSIGPFVIHMTLRIDNQKYALRGVTEFISDSEQKYGETLKVAIENILQKLKEEIIAAQEQPDLASDHQEIPEPESWKFPGVIESARTISPQNSEGRTFNKYGLAYSLDELKSLSVATMSAQELQKYADIVTHAYPDAVFRNAPASCKNIPVDSMNETSLANTAYVSLNAVKADTRERAASCLSDMQSLLLKNK